MATRKSGFNRRSTAEQVTEGIDLSGKTALITGVNSGLGFESMRVLAAREGLDPNRWLENVELIVARRIGRETVRYVRNVFKYYVSYRLAFDAGRERTDLEMNR